jgi:hypothetical protein
LGGKIQTKAAGAKALPADGSVGFPFLVKIRKGGRAKNPGGLFQGQGLDGALIQTGAAVNAGVLVHFYLFVLHAESFAGARIHTGATTRAFFQID